MVVSGAGAVTGGALVRGQYDQASAKTMTTAAKPIHMVRDELRAGVVLRSGAGLLKSFVMNSPPLRHKPLAASEVPKHQMTAKAPATF